MQVQSCKHPGVVLRSHELKLVSCSTPYGSSSSSDSSDGDSEEEVAELGQRARKKVDYVAMNSEMFGEEDEDVDGSSGSDYN